MWEQNLGIVDRLGLSGSGGGKEGFNKHGALINHTPSFTHNRA